MRQSSVAQEANAGAGTSARARAGLLPLPSEVVVPSMPLLISGWVEGGSDVVVSLVAIAIATSIGKLRQGSDGGNEVGVPSTYEPMGWFVPS